MMRIKRRYLGVVAVIVVIMCFAVACESNKTAVCNKAVADKRDCSELFRLGDTYIEVSLAGQHMWYVKEGKTVMDTDIVSGKLRGSNRTPTGKYQVLEKKEEVTLWGERSNVSGKPDFIAPVRYWIGFTDTGLGFHDATWLPEFGKDACLSGGTGGNINMPYDAMELIFDEVEINTPVIIY